MDVRVREWSKLPYLNAEAVLRGLRNVQLEISGSPDLPQQVKNLRTRELRRIGEGRQAAIFSYGMSTFIGKPVSFAHREADDYDFIARFESSGRYEYVPVQLKEIPPESLVAAIEVQRELDKLKKYADSPDLVVAIYVNRALRIEPGTFHLPATSVREVWLFGATSDTQDEWVLVGNLLSDAAEATRFRYPGA